LSQFSKKLFFDLGPSIYALSAICLFSVTGAIVIYCLPDAYSMIYTKPLFKWLLLNRRWDTFWIYIIIVLFAFTGITAVICLWRDIKRRHVAVAVFHLCFLLVMLSHLINSLYSFKVLENLIPKGKSYAIPLSPDIPPLNIYLNKVDFDKNKYGMIQNIRANINYIENGQNKSATLSVNNPVKINKTHLILKDLAPYLNSITLYLKHNDIITPVTMQMDKPFKGKGYRFEFLTANENFTQIKVLYEEGRKKDILDIHTDSLLSIKGKNYAVERILPDIIPSIVVDVSYDPSLMLMFLASTIFVIVLTAQAVKKIVKREM